MTKQQFLEILYLFQGEINDLVSYGGQEPIGKSISINDGSCSYHVNTHELKIAIDEAFKEDNSKDND